MARSLSPTLAIGAVAAVLLCACGPGPQPPAELGDIVARVNGEEITVRQLNERLGRTGPPPQGGPAASRRKALEELVNERLLVQQALNAGLDRQPQTLMAIEQARRQLLARSVVDASGADEVADGDVRAFYEANPHLFARRKVYTFRRFTIPEGRIDGATRARLDAARTPAAVTAALRQAGLQHVQFTETVTAEALAPAVLARATHMARGDVLLLGEGARTVLMQLANSIPEPLTLAEAAPSIEAYLAEATRQQKAERIVRDLRRSSKIEYVTQTAAGEPAVDTAGGPALHATGKSAIAASRKPPADEPTGQKPIQSRQMTAVR
jgi:EpsD family peptidyl-prolyl cis-trans isomerase